VPEKFLDGLYTLTLLTQKAGERVSECVPSNALRYAGRDSCRLDVILQG
jgi:hypothetical protein